MANAKREHHQRAIRAANLALELLGDMLANVTDGRFDLAARQALAIDHWAAAALVDLNCATMARGTWVRGHQARRSLPRALRTEAVRS